MTDVWESVALAPRVSGLMASMPLPDHRILVVEVDAMVSDAGGTFFERGLAAKIVSAEGVVSRQLLYTEDEDRHSVWRVSIARMSETQCVVAYTRAPLVSQTRNGWAPHSTPVSQVAVAIEVVGDSAVLTDTYDAPVWGEVGWPQWPVLHVGGDLVTGGKALLLEGDGASVVARPLSLVSGSITLGASQVVTGARSGLSYSYPSGNVEGIRTTSDLAVGVDYALVRWSDQISWWNNSASGWEQYYRGAGARPGETEGTPALTTQLQVLTASGASVTTPGTGVAGFDGVFPGESHDASQICFSGGADYHWPYGRTWAAGRDNSLELRGELAVRADSPSGTDGVFAWYASADGTSYQQGGGTSALRFRLMRLSFGPSGVAVEDWMPLDDYLIPWGDDGWGSDNFWRPRPLFAPGGAALYHRGPAPAPSWVLDQDPFDEAIPDDSPAGLFHELSTPIAFTGESPAGLGTGWVIVYGDYKLALAESNRVMSVTAQVITGGLKYSRSAFIST